MVILLGTTRKPLLTRGPIHLQIKKINGKPKDKEETKEELQGIRIKMLKIKMGLQHQQTHYVLQNHAKNE